MAADAPASPMPSTFASGCASATWSANGTAEQHDERHDDGLRLQVPPLQALQEGEREEAGDATNAAALAAACGTPRGPAAGAVAP